MAGSPHKKRFMSPRIRTFVTHRFIYVTSTLVHERNQWTVRKSACANDNIPTIICINKCISCTRIPEILYPRPLHFATRSGTYLYYVGNNIQENPRAY